MTAQGRWKILEDLAKHVGVSTYYFHRVFKKVTGLTPRAYAGAHRAKRVRAELARRATVTEAIYGRAGGANTEVRFAIGECSLGSILVA